MDRALNFHNASLRARGQDPFGDDDNDLDLAEVAERVAVGSHTILSLRDESLNSESAHDLIK